MFRAIMGIVAVVGLAAAITKPSTTRIDDMIVTELQAAIESGDTGKISSPAGQLLLAACQSESAACARIIGSTVRVTYRDQKLFARVIVSGLGRDASCIAAFATLYCPEGFAN